MEELDQSSSSTLPRLRVTRNTFTDPPSWRNTVENNLGAERSDSNLPAIPHDYQSASEDDFAADELQGTNARLLSGSLPPVDDSFQTNETSHRLKSILERFDNSIRATEATSRTSMPLTPSEPDSDFDLEPAQSARHSIRSLIENALRDPGNTPRKSRLMRRASFNASDSPRVDKTIRRSLSDEEREAQLHHASEVGINDSVTEPPQAGKYLDSRVEDQDVSSRTSQAETAHRFSRIPFHSGSITRHKFHKDLEPFKPISSESGLSSPEKSRGHTSGFKKTTSNFNPDNFSPHSNSDTRDALKFQFLATSSAKNGVDNHLRPVSPISPTSSTRTPSPSRSRTQTSPSIWHSQPRNSSPARKESRKFSHKESESKDASFDVSWSISDNEDRERMRELERNWNRHRPQYAPTRNMGSISPSFTRIADSIGQSSRLKLNSPNLHDSSAPPDPNTQFRKGHRRTVTELSEFARESSPTTEPTVVSDGSTESFEPPHMSTPTSKSPKLPDFSTLSNGSYNRDAMQADLARLHKATQPPGFAIPSRTLLQSPDLPLSSKSTDDLKNDISPSTTSVDDAHTPVRPDIDLIYPKTPRPPGAFGTPYSQPCKLESGNFAPTIPAVSPETPLVYGNNSEYPQSNYGMDTIATPAPPGGYRMTPGTVKRKGILKVRFDDTKAKALTDDLIDHSHISESKNEARDSPAASLETETLFESPTRRKGLRLVDEYGRVRKFTEDGTEVPLDRRGTVSKSDIATQQAVTLTGIEPINVTGQTSVESSVASRPSYNSQIENSATEFSFGSNDKKAVVSHLTKTLGEMQVALAQEEEALAQSVSTEKAMDNGRLSSLTTVSRTARLEREKLSRRLELEKDVEGKIQTRVFTARNTLHTQRGSWWTRRWRLLLLGLLLELCFLYLGYRIALIHSKHLWLGTHFDPFYPALYIHKSHSTLSKNLGILPVNWSAFSVPGTIGDNEIGYAMKSFGRRLWETALNWRSASWDNWGDAFTESAIAPSWPS